ncbi:MAG: hypothetical protein ACTS9Y_02800 [Methylophilus sp.]|uniref:hypothetical protein n=1 Tax=Methylophilus sp. TaxID=29541 RepID=UPI003FA0400D
MDGFAKQVRFNEITRGNQAMVLNKINTILLAAILFTSVNAQATLQTFEEVFTGTFSAVNNELDFYDDATTLTSGDVTLTLYYQVIPALQIDYPAVGTFTRTDVTGAFSGNFFFYSLLDPDVISITGFFDHDRDSILPNTGAYQYASGFGDAAGTITGQGNVNLKVNWQIHTPDVFTPVPEPQMGWLLSLGLVTLCLRRAQKKVRMISQQAGLRLTTLTILVMDYAPQNQG